MTRFDFVNTIGPLSREQKMRFYLFLARNLTVSIRTFWSDTAIDSAVQVSRIKLINEVMHRILNRLIDLQDEHQLWTETNVWQLIQNSVIHDPVVADEVDEAIQVSYNQLPHTSSSTTV